MHNKSKGGSRWDSQFFKSEKPSFSHRYSVQFKKLKYFTFRPSSNWKIWIEIQFMPGQFFVSTKGLEQLQYPNPIFLGVYASGSGLVQTEGGTASVKTFKLLQLQKTSLDSFLRVQKKINFVLYFQFTSVNFDGPRPVKNGSSSDFCYSPSYF